MKNSKITAAVAARKIAEVVSVGSGIALPVGGWKYLRGGGLTEKESDSVTHVWVYAHAIESRLEAHVRMSLRNPGEAGSSPRKYLSARAICHAMMADRTPEDGGLALKLVREDAWASFGFPGAGDKDRRLWEEVKGIANQVDQSVENSSAEAAHFIGLAEGPKEGLLSWEEFLKALRVTDDYPQRNRPIGRLFRGVMGLLEGGERSEPFATIFCLVKRWGWGVVVGPGSPLSQKAQDLAVAFTSRAAASEYLAQHGNRHHGSVNPKGYDEDRLGAGISWQPETDLDFLERMFPGIVEETLG